MQIDFNRWWAKAQLTDASRLRLYRKIAKMLSNGLPLLKVLEEMQSRASDGGRNPKESLAIVLDEWRRAVQNGLMLSEGMAGWVPQSEQMIIAAGEQSGHLEDALIAVVSVVQSGKRIKNAVFSGLAYPVAILTMVIIYIFIFGTRVIPEFARMVDPSHWRGAARSLYLMSQFVRGWMPLIVAILVALIATVLISMPRWRGNTRVFLDRLPPYSIYRLVVGSGFLMAFSALQSAGVTVEKALMRMSDNASPWLHERLDGALLGVKSGLNCGEALRNAEYGFPSKEIVDDLCVYAEYRGFSEALKMLADEWLDDGVERISAQMQVLNGIAIVTLAIVIAWLVTGFFGIQQEIAALSRVAR
ncbi:type II secretion system F family protein [Noviherbaspirillum saxi]|uniref:Type II secretion system protein F n=1 Tax=Noviherbaspirillum saxi TaxID=2320863 RepID=A0A3A3FL92_9BURK|nr:type II secretion system F family protein [Noviherbaspirillum saxi]RJF92125.1 type II secretion system protein F [Noviherbaspirillum saxi]